ncbi:MAG: carboxylating nicotinate-nucleotide diphosphorylase [Planctomycetaceae bacterium]
MTASPGYSAAERRAVESLIDLALAEDLSTAGDVTTLALIDDQQPGTVHIVARESGVVAGLPVVGQVFERLDPAVVVESRVADSARIERGQAVARLTGPLRSLLIGERTALNFLTHLSGVATATSRLVAKIAGTRASIYDTRKTLPGWRALEKYAVRAGGGHNHRQGLYDMVLIKDNHRAGWLARGSDRTIAAAVRQARASAPSDMPVEVEVETLEQLADALSARPSIVMLDNMTCDQMRRAVALRDATAPEVELEASGSITLESVAEVARSGVERISVGAITHSATALDLAFDWAGSTGTTHDH